MQVVLYCVLYTCKTVAETQLGTFESCGTLCLPHTPYVWLDLVRYSRCVICIELQ
jgi:hypothetical protein